MELCKELEDSEKYGLTKEGQRELRGLRDRKNAAAGNFKEFLLSKIAGRSILIWGAVKRNDFLLGFAKEYDIPISGYLDTYKGGAALNGYPIENPAEIAAPVGQYLFIGLDAVYEDVLKQLSDWGLLPYEDYFYWGKNDLIITSCQGGYSDFLGNQITGNVTGFSVYLEHLSNLHIGKNCKIDATVNLVLGKNSFLEIGDNCILKKNSSIFVRANASVHIGNNCVMRESTRIVSGSSSVVFLSDHFRSGANFRSECYNGCIFVHSGCLFSTDIIVQGDNGHPLYDLQRRCGINNPERHVTEIGEHVWIGRRCDIRYGARIGAGSVIGMGSFVCKEVPCNVMAAGNPLRILRENIAWSRKRCSDPDVYFENYDFR